MESCSRVYDASHMTNALLKNELLPCTSEVLDSNWLPNKSPSFPASASMVNFEEFGGDKHVIERPVSANFDMKSENCDEELDGCFQQPAEKKRRLKPDQVQFLEKSFEVDNKLEPDRKLELAKQVGLQPRQVAIWFQNRRARFKTKVLEKEYDSLKSRFDQLKKDYDNLCTENQNLKSEVNLLTHKLKPKQEPDATSSDVLDSDSPHHDDDEDDRTDGNDSGVLENAADSSNLFDDETFQQTNYSSCLPKLEMECYEDLQPNSCNLGYPVQDQGTWFWQY